MQRDKFYLRFIALFFTLFLIFIPNSFAEDQNTENSAPLKQEQLDQLLAPVALYPDSLLTQILMASTYPQEIVDADSWLNENDNKSLTGDALDKALEPKTWDPSVKSLINFPQVLDMMNNQISWTQQLGYAVMTQQQDVLDTIQKLRQKAQKNGKLKTTSQQIVTTDSSNDIIIEPSSTNVVYVPIYNPSVVYGSWWWPYYPPYYFYPLGYGVPGDFIAFSAGFILGSSWGYSWGGFNWQNGYMNVNVNRNINYNENINRNAFRNQSTWTHDASKPFNRSTTLAKPSQPLSSTGLKGQRTFQKPTATSTTGLLKSKTTTTGSLTKGLKPSKTTQQSISSGLKSQKTTAGSLTKGLKPSKTTQQSISSGLKTRRTTTQLQTTNKTFAPVNKRPSYETNSMVRPGSVSRLHNSHTAPSYSHVGSTHVGGGSGISRIKGKH